MLWTVLRPPAARLDVRLGDELVNIIADGFDLAISLGRLDDSGLVRRSFGRIDRWLVASPDYLARAGTPRTVADLADHGGILTRTDLDHWSRYSTSPDRGG